MPTAQNNSTNCAENQILERVRGWSPIATAAAPERVAAAEAAAEDGGRGREWFGEYREAERPRGGAVAELLSFADQLLAFTKCCLISVFLIMKALLKFAIPPAPKDIKGQLALVSGGGNGLGRALSLELTRLGARVAVVDVDTAAARRTAAELCRLAGRAGAARAFTADVASPQDVRALQRQIVKEFGGEVEILVNNAGLLAPVSLLNGSDRDIERVLDVNLKSHFWMLRTFLPAMQRAGCGHVLTISSMAGVSPLSRAVAYTATKFGVRGLSLALQAELRDAGASGVRVTVAYPYFLTTRKEPIDNVELRVPAIDPDVAAQKIVDGLRRNYVHVGVPAYGPYISNILSAMPDEVAELFRKTFKAEIKPETNLEVEKLL